MNECLAQLLELLDRCEKCTRLSEVRDIARERFVVAERAGIAPPEMPQKSAA